MNIYVGNLDYKLQENELEELFGEYGEVSSVKIITDKYTGKSKGFGFVEMPDDGQAETAIEALNGKEANGRQMRVNKARPRN
ncbi:MAG: RNA-binding protein [Bacteroidales bacterium]